MSSVEEHLYDALVSLGLDLSDPNLKETPKRIAKMWEEEFFCNVNKDKFDGYKIFPNDRENDQIIVSDKIHFTSMCAHHFLPFDGYAWLLYVPNDCVVGLSKLSRLVNFYARRPQNQETLSVQIVDDFYSAIEPQGCMVVMRGIHGCMKCRGVRQIAGGGMITSAIRGCFSDPIIKSEGLDLIKISLMI